MRVLRWWSADVMTITDIEAVEAKRAAQIAFVRGATQEPLPPPLVMGGIIGWLRANLFTGWLNILLTVLSVAAIIWIVPPLIKFLLIDATWTGLDREACITTPTRSEVGACWPFITDRLNFFIYGFYPIPLRWRVDVFFALLALGVMWLLSLRAPRRDL